jgi:hypothetical protein
MTRILDEAPHDARRAALKRRIDRLKVVTWAATAGAGLALWAIVSGAVADTTAATPSQPATSGQESGTTDLFGGGSTLGTGSSTPVLRSHGS